jgi:hypothetical protein
LSGNIPQIQVFTGILTLRMEIELEMEKRHPGAGFNSPVCVLLANRFLDVSEKLTAKLLPFPAWTMDDIVDGFLDFVTGSGEVCFDNCHAENIVRLILLKTFFQILLGIFPRLFHNLLIDFCIAPKQVAKDFCADDP